MKDLIKFEPHLLALLAVILIINLFLITSINIESSKKLAEAKEANRPADIKLTIIKPDCSDCFDINLVIDDIKSKNTNIVDENVLTGEQASDLIERYDIKKLPALIVEGEIDKFELGLEKKGDVLLFNEPEPPYYDLSMDSVLGRVSLTLITDTTCEKCSDLSVVVEQFRELMSITNEEILTREQASNLISTYKIIKLPTIILSKDASEYGVITDTWNQIGSVESDGSFVVRDINPPYIDTITDEVKGLVNLIYITDKACIECYDVKNHRQILENFGVYINEEETKEISESSLLLSRYSIEKIPTIMLSKEASDYPRLTAVWKDVGTIEDDGTYIFREAQIMGTVKDLNTGELLKTQ